MHFDNNQPTTHVMSDDKRWTREEIWSNIREYDIVRSVVALYELQTAEEKRTKRTINRNNVGFNATDDDFLTDLAESAIEWKKKNGELSLSPGQKEAARPLMKKYCAQLSDIANDDLDSRRM